MPLAVIDHPSPNHGVRAGGCDIDMIVLHYTGMQSGPAALARLCDGAAEVSAHYLIEEDGRIFHLVPETRRAWHAGAGSWRGREDVNSRSIGIELVNPGHEWGYRPFAEAQIAATLDLLGALVARHGIAPGDVVGHSDIAPARKDDPGELFPWGRLAAAGVGLYPPEDLPAGRAFDPASTQRGLAAYGYACPVSGAWDAPTEAVIRAFQRHFRPARIDGIWCADCAARLDWLRAAAGRTPPRPG